MRIEVYLSKGCQSELGLRENLRQALEAEGLPAAIAFVRISDQEARRRGLRGSPSILVDGREVLPPGEAAQGFS